jgi:hypothetical protein
VESLEDDPTGRGYKIGNINLTQLLTVVSALISLVVLGLYVSSPKVLALYTSPTYLWAVALTHHKKHDNTTAHKYVGEVYKARTLGLET